MQFVSLSRIKRDSGTAFIGFFSFSVTGQTAENQPMWEAGEKETKNRPLPAFQSLTGSRKVISVPFCSVSMRRRSVIIRAAMSGDW